jgi:hypothetical protein
MKPSHPSDNTPIEGTVKDITPVKFIMVHKTPVEPLWDDVVRQYHYLDYRKMLGANLKHLAFLGSRPVAAVGFSSVALKVEARDSFIGWSAVQRKKHLPQLANSNRFLILAIACAFKGYPFIAVMSKGNSIEMARMKHKGTVLVCCLYIVITF